MNSSRTFYLTAFLIGSSLFYSKDFKLLVLQKKKVKKNWLVKNVQTLVVQSFIFAVVFLITRSANISLPISIVASYFPHLHQKNSERKAEESRRKAWPLVIDQLATASASGVPLHSALIELESRGPAALRAELKAFRESFDCEGSLEIGLSRFVDSAKKRAETNHVQRATQLKSTILLARDFGGPEIGVILRNLSINYREKESALDEIATRQSWIKNGAVLASLTPWILLVILSFHPQTISAYNSNSGRAVLVVGLVLTVIAYKWITRISQSVLSR